MNTIIGSKIFVISHPILILAEGVTDQEFLNKLLQRDDLKTLRNLIQVHSVGSYENLAGSLESIYAKNVPGHQQLEVLAVIVDSDERPSTRAAQMQVWLGKDKTTKFHKVLLLIPSANEAGALESLVLKTLSKDDLNCATAYVDCIEGSATLNTAQRDKLMMYAWTSQQQKEPVTNFMRVKRDGARAIDVNHTAFDPIVQFLKKLADSCSPKS